jgi:hypothetical protein
MEIGSQTVKRNFGIGGKTDAMIDSRFLKILHHVQYSPHQLTHGEVSRDPRLHFYSVRPKPLPSFSSVNFKRCMDVGTSVQKIEDSILNETLGSRSKG